MISTWELVLLAWGEKEEFKVGVLHWKHFAGVHQVVWGQALLDPTHQLNRFSLFPLYVLDLVDGNAVFSGAGTAIPRALSIRRSLIGLNRLTSSSCFLDR